MSASIINSYPTTLQNGQLEDATVVMTLFAWIQSQVNGNACAATTGASVLKGDGAGNTTSAVAGTDYLGVTPGLIFDYAGTSAPTGYLLCDGSAVSRATYANLFNAIGTTWGVGDGSTTFNVPDLRRKTTIGSGGTAVGPVANTVGATGGEETHTLVTAELATHNHGVTDPGHLHSITDPSHTHSPATVGNGSIGNVPAGGTTVAVVGNQSIPSAVTNISINTATTGVTTQNNGSGAAHNNMQPSAVVTKIIKV